MPNCVEVNKVVRRAFVKKVWVYFFVLFSLLYMFPNSAISNDKRKPLSLVIASDVLSDYHKFLGDREPVEIKDYSGNHSRRDVVEVVLLQQALARGGFQAEVLFKTADKE